MAAGQSLVRAVEATLLAIPFAFVYQHRLFDFSQSTPLALSGLFVATELVYYWQHRASHRIHWMWATHAVHHSATNLNFLAAVRPSSTRHLSRNLLFSPPCVVCRCYS